MGYSRFDPATRGRAPWNTGKTVGTKRPLTQKQIWAIRFFLDREARLRDRALFDLAIDSKLRGCDLVKIKIGDLVAGPEIRTRAIVVQQKTSSSNLQVTYAQACSLGSNAAAAQSTTMRSRAGLIRHTT